MHSPDPDAWQRVAAALKARRTELGVNQAQVYAAGGPSIPTLRSLETAAAHTYQDPTIAALEQAVQWRPGSVESILNGGQPTPADGGDLTVTITLPPSAAHATEEQRAEITARAHAEALKAWREIRTTP